MQTPAQSGTLVHPLQTALAVLAAAACLFVTIAIWRSVSTLQPMWPLPGLYFVELPAVAVITSLTFLRSHPASTAMAWATAGIFLAFAIMGAFSVGIFYGPIAIMFFLLAVLATVRQEWSGLKGLGTFLIAAIAQAALMFLLIALLYTGH